MSEACNARIVKIRNKAMERRAELRKLKPQAAS